MKLESLSVRQQLILAFSLLAAMVLLVSLLGMRAMASGHEDFADYVGQTSRRGRLVTDLIEATNARAVSARNLVLVTQDSDRSAEKTAVTQAHDKVLTQLAALKKALEQTPDADARERKLFAEVEAIEASYGRVALDIVRMALEGQHDAAIGKMNSECRPLLAKLLATTGEYLKHLDTHAVVELKEAEASYLWNRSAMLVFCGLAIGLALLLSWRITAALLRALGAEPAALREAAQRVADGDLSPVTGGGDAPQRSVLAALSRMQQDLARVVARVRQASESIATGTAQIATGNVDLSQRTEEQASSLQQTAASMEQLSTTVKHNAATAQLATQLAGGASSAATQGGALVTQVVATMGSISESSRRIADIIGTIDGIAFQTNILALNAAVEAARAGEQGRGFAVVAGEVRNLAQRSASAAREIKGLIGDSVERVEAGSRLVNQAGTGMDDIVNQVRRVAELISEISQASSEQTGGIDQVSNAVQLLDQTTQQNAALVEQSAAASESLRQQTTALTEVVRSFKLDASLQLST